MRDCLHLNDTVKDGWPRFYGIDVSDNDEIFVCSTDEKKSILFLRFAPYLLPFPNSPIP